MTCSTIALIYTLKCDRFPAPVLIFKEELAGLIRSFPLHFNLSEDYIVYCSMGLAARGTLRVPAPRIAAVFDRNTKAPVPEDIWAEKVYVGPFHELSG